jgi:hypothetical protein
MSESPAEQEFKRALSEKTREKAQIPEHTEPVQIGSGSRGSNAPRPGTNSFQAALAETPDVLMLGLARTVQQDEVGKVDQSRCKVRVAGDGTLLTWDGKYNIHSTNGTIRYVLTAEDDGLVLWASQAVAEELTTKQIMEEYYPILSSHAQIDGQVIGAGDMAVSNGRITSISNKSGTWQPRGRQLAMTLKWLVRTGILDENAIVSRTVTVSQWISKPDGYNVDEGELYQLIGGVMEGKLASKQEGKLASKQKEKLIFQQEDNDSAGDDDTPDDDTLDDDTRDGGDIFKMDDLPQ